MPREATSKSHPPSLIGSLELLRDAAEKAAFVLKGCQFIDVLRSELSGSAIAPRALLQHCAHHAEGIARRLGGAEPQLTQAGWSIPPYHPGMLPAHVFAAAAKLAIETCAGTSPSVDLLICQQLADNAVFMHGRQALAQQVEATTLAKEAQIRSLNAKKGGAQQKFSDDDLVAAHAKWLAQYGKKRGWIKAAACQFDVAEKTISVRWQKLNKRN